MKVITPTEARKNLYGIMKSVQKDSMPIEISSKRAEQEGVVIVSKNDWEALQETLYLQRTGVLEKIRQHENEETEDLEVLDWDSM